MMLEENQMLRRRRERFDEVAFMQAPEEATYAFRH